MPRTVDLTDDEGGLHDLASFRLLAVMIYPEEKRARQTLLNFIERDIADSEENPVTLDGHTRGRPPLNNDRFWKVFSKVLPAGGTAAGVLIALVRQAERGKEPVLSTAVNELTDGLSTIRRQTPHDFEYGPGRLALSGHRNRSAVLEDWRKFRNVAHLWAAHTDVDVWDGDPTSIRDFLSEAERWAVRALRAHVIDRSTNSLIDIRHAWRCRTPANFRAAT